MMSFSHCLHHGNCFDRGSSFYQCIVGPHCGFVDRRHRVLALFVGLFFPFLRLFVVFVG